MQESYNFLRDLIKFAQCNKRQQKCKLPEPKFNNKKLMASWAKAHSRQKKETRSDSDDAFASTEPGETSNNEFSDKSYQTDASISGFSGQHGQRVPKASSIRSRNAVIRPPPGLDAPPGLEPTWSIGTDAPAWQRPETRLNAEAACFVPSTAAVHHSGGSSKPANPCFAPGLCSAPSDFEESASHSFTPQLPKSQQLRQSIKMLKGALEEWEANLPRQNVPAAPLQQHATDAMGTIDHLADLQQALTKLTPDQASMMRNLLDEKASMVSTSRPFTPFGASQPPWDQVRARLPQKTAPRVNASGPGFDESLKDHLRDLAELDSARVLMVRKINRLGLDSPLKLKEYFSGFGSIERVMVAHTRCPNSRAKATGAEKGRVRPAPLGFVVMSRAEDAMAALVKGAEHAIEGVEIGVFPFESHPMDEAVHA